MAKTSDLPDARVVVGTARLTLSSDWDTVIVPDADGMLLGSGMGVVERGFRLLFRAAEAARERLFIQTKVPRALRIYRLRCEATIRRFAAAELPRLRSLGYPPFAHLADVAFEGAEKAALRAVESDLAPRFERGGSDVGSRTADTTSRREPRPGKCTGAGPENANQWRESVLWPLVWPPGSKGDGGLKVKS